MDKLAQMHDAGASVRDDRGVIRAPGALLVDQSGHRQVGPGSDLFPVVFTHGVFVDKSLLIRDIAAHYGRATLFCRPRRFGKTLAATMLKDFFECAPCADPSARPRFERLSIWEVDGGRWREQQGRYPVVMLSLKGASGESWDEMRECLAALVAAECERHRYLLESPTLSTTERAQLQRLTAKGASAAELSGSLRFLTEMLARHHGTGCVVILDEYDAPITHARQRGFYDRAVDFMRTWLSGALKTNPALAFGVLTGVQRISKEPIFSGLNNIKVNTPLTPASDERFGFTQAEVEALAAYMGCADKLDELRVWYDGYRFGCADIYNPWSVLSYLGEGCIAQPYWVNTSGNSVLTDVVAHASEQDLRTVYELLEPGGSVMARIDPNIAFGDASSLGTSLWSLLYLGGYVTTDDTAYPEDPDRRRRLRIPNREVASAYRREVVMRAAHAAGGVDRLDSLHDALAEGDASAFERELSAILAKSASYYDLTSESACSMLVLGLLFGVDGYDDPVSNREAGYGRFDVQLAPSPTRPMEGRQSTITIEVKFMKPADYERYGDEGPRVLHDRAQEAVGQIDRRAYDAPTPGLRWGVAFAGKHVAATCTHAPASS